MLEKINGMNVELKAKVPKANEQLCSTCDGVGWLYNKEKGCIEKCTACYDGVLHICEDCHKPLRGLCNSEECVLKRQEKQEKALLSKATLADYEDVPAENKEMMYSDKFPYNNGYFSDLEELIEYCEDEGIELPEYVWGTEKYTLELDASSIVASACDDLHEDAYSNITGEEELQKLLDEWCEKQSGVDTYNVSYEYAIKVKKGEEMKLIDKGFKFFNSEYKNKSEIIDNCCPYDMDKSLDDLDINTYKFSEPDVERGCRGITCEQCWDREMTIEEKR